jgi:hypothetical protein
LEGGTQQTFASSPIIATGRAVQYQRSKACPVPCGWQLVLGAEAKAGVVSPDAPRLKERETTMPKENELEGRQDMGASMVVKPACRSRRECPAPAGHRKRREGARTARGQSEGSGGQQEGPRRRPSWTAIGFTAPRRFCRS